MLLERLESDMQSYNVALLGFIFLVEAPAAIADYIFR